MIVVSTGFKVTEMAARLNITGRGGKNLAEAWADENPTAYLGLTVPDFPNFFTMLGPNTGPAHGGSVIFQAECQSRYITACLIEMIERRIAAIDVDAGGARRLRRQGRSRARADDLDASRHVDLLPQSPWPGVLRDALAIRGLLGHDA